MPMLLPSCFLDAQALYMVAARTRCALAPAFSTTEETSFVRLAGFICMTDRRLLLDSRSMSAFE